MRLLAERRYAPLGGRERQADGTEDYIDYAVSSYDRDFTLSLTELERRQMLLVEDALRLGYRIGICANSDGHKTRPGASYPGAGEFGSLGGLTCVLAEALDREHVLQALVRVTGAKTSSAMRLQGRRMKSRPAGFPGSGSRKARPRLSRSQRAVHRWY